MSAADLGLAILYNGGPEGLFALGGLPALALCQFLTGTGSSAGISAALKATSQSFAKASRGAAMGVVLSGFGLSAFFYSSLGRAHLVAAADPTCAFLLTLAIGTGLSMFLGATFVRPPLPAAAASTGQYEPLASSAQYEALSSDDVRGLSRSRSHSPVPPHPADEYSLHSGIVIREDDDDNALAPERPDALRRRSASPLLGAKEDDGHAAHSAGDLNVSGWALLRERDFWALFCLLGTCSGVGLMTVNNLGTLVVTLSPPDTPPLEVALAQSRLVSLLSVLNCAGRLAVGFCSDYFTHSAGRARFPRVWWLVVLAGVFVVSQVLAGRAERVEDLALPTAVVGGAYGMLFGSVPVVCLERCVLLHIKRTNWHSLFPPQVRPLGLFAEQRLPHPLPLRLCQLHQPAVWGVLKLSAVPSCPQH